MNWLRRQRKPTHRRTVTEALTLLDKVDQHEEQVTVCKSKSEEQIRDSPPITKAVDTSQTCFKVLWAKPSGRKNRVWEGDGTLKIVGNTATLYGEDDKILSTASAPPPRLLISGSIFFVGSKEIEIIEELNDNDAPPSKKRILDSKPLFNRRSKKFKPNTALDCPSFSGIRKSFHHNTAEPLILPPPPCEHQWKFNPDKKCIVDVKVDSFLISTLRPHQREGLTFLYECVMGYKHQYTGAILADEMGLGKTLQCISLIWTLLKHGPYGLSIIRRALVIAPSTLCASWQKEFLKWLGRERLQPFLIDNTKKPIDFQNQRSSPVMIISYERLVKHSMEIEEMNFDLIICDEAHRLKNSTIKAAQTLKNLACTKRVLLTGTPVQNDLQEYYVLADVANPGILGTYVEFKDQFERPILLSQKPDCPEEERLAGEEKAANLNFITSRFILRRTQEVLEKVLPSKTEYVLCCNLTPLQNKIYHSVINEYWDTQGFSRLSPLSLIILLKKICNHPLLLRVKEDTNEEDPSAFNSIKDSLNTNCIKKESSSKLMVLRTLIKNIMNTNEKIVIVSSSTQMLDILADECDFLNVHYSRLDGNTPIQNRQRLVDNFNAKDNTIDVSKITNVFLLSSRAGGVGLSLPGASRLVLFDSDWNPAIDNQAMARIWRDGQKKPVHIYRFLTTGTIEEKIYQRQIYKTGLSDAVLDSVNVKSTLKLSDAELKDLFTSILDSESITHDMIQCSCLGDGSHMPDESDESNDENSEPLININSATKENIPCSINQLKTWDHYRPEYPQEFLQESGLEGTADFISFIFRKMHKKESEL